MCNRDAAAYRGLESSLLRKEEKRIAELDLGWVCRKIWRLLNVLP
jgi:hypothetical protein